ncbi:DUF655 domain-containing protein [Candidatus Micrarchaeota archaeon]|nr:DUF655 domain-containing protein [Candidatus Micrarchaeota archaeon]
MEEYAYVIEYLPAGHASESGREPVVQMIGEDDYTLLEASVKPGVEMIVSKRAYIGKGERQEISRIKKRLEYEELTSSATSTLPMILKKMIEEKPDKYLAFINKAGPISMRSHQLDLLPGIGKKNMERIIEEREKEPFKSFKDIQDRVSNMGDPIALFVNRIMIELQGKERHYLFVKPPARK